MLTICQGGAAFDIGTMPERGGNKSAFPPGPAPASAPSRRPSHPGQSSRETPGRIP
jgi:hypothetical protein